MDKNMIINYAKMNRQLLSCLQSVNCIFPGIKNFYKSSKFIAHKFLHCMVHVCIWPRGSEREEKREREGGREREREGGKE